MSAKQNQQSSAPAQEKKAAPGGKIKKQPERRCTGCNGTFPKKELVRVVRAPDGTVSIDFTGKKSGRGAYVCHNPACLKAAVKAKRLQRSLECEIPDEVMEALQAELEGGE